MTTTVSRLFGLSALIVAIVVVTHLGLERISQPEPRTALQPVPPIVGTTLPAPPAEQFDDRPTLLAIGDSYVGGTGDPTITVYPEHVADAMGWSLRLDAVGGSGYLPRNRPDGEIVPALAARLPDDIASFEPDIILIDAGRNDLATPASEIIPAMSEYLRDVRAAWPDQTLVVVKPQYASPEVPADYPELAVAIDQVAAEIGAVTVDPVADGWWDRIDVDSLLVADKIHLNAAGTEYYADRIIDSLEDVGLRSGQAEGGR